MFGSGAHYITGSVVLCISLSGCGKGDHTEISDAGPADSAPVTAKNELRPDGDTSISQDSSGGRSTDAEQAAKSATTAIAVSSSSVTPGVTPASSGAGNRSEQVPSPFPDDEATRTLADIQALRVSALPPELDAARSMRRERNERIIEMATRVIRLTMDDESRSPQFHHAIGQLLEARFQLALSGSEDDVESLDADVHALRQRDPKSIAAAEGAYYAAKFAHTQAGLSGKSQPGWLEAFSRRARDFADHFPEQAQRAVTLLFGAARSCELHAESAADKELATRLLTESRLCYSTLAEKFPSSSQGQEAIASLRRLSLPGQKLTQFSGPTIDGGFITAEEFPGKPTLIFFWESETEEFTEQLLPVLAKVQSQLPPEALRIIGVALDDEEIILNDFMETHEVPGRQIFFSNPSQRAWDSPLIRFWGIAQSPCIWLIDSEGVVVSTSIRTDELVPQLRNLLQNPAR